jgi:hypothetical protein
MKALVFKPTKTRPFVCFDPENRKYEISGHSYPEDPHDTYNPIIEWLHENIEYLDHCLVLTLNTDYFNSASNRLLLKIFRILELYYKAGKDIEINWYSEDEDIQGEGNVFSKLVDLPFRFHTVEE